MPSPKHRNKYADKNIACVNCGKKHDKRVNRCVRCNSFMVFSKDEIEEMNERKLMNAFWK